MIGTKLLLVLFLYTFIGLVLALISKLEDEATDVQMCWIIVGWFPLVVCLCLHLFLKKNLCGATVHSSDIEKRHKAANRSPELVRYLIDGS